MTDAIATRIDVLVCTYRRPALLVATLDGVARCAAALRGAAGVRIVVVDNDAAESAREPVRLWALHAAVPVDYRTQPRQNISLTRNLALDAVTAPWIAMIDDDEVPDVAWLAALLATARATGADVVFGPVISEFASDAPAWATHGTLFQRKRFATGTVMPVNETRTANAFLRAARLAQDGFRFDPILGLSGGEDSELFARMARRQYRMVWCDDACVREWTPPSRTTLPWVLKRAFRVGSVDAFNRRRFRRGCDLAGGLLKYSVFVVHGSVLAVACAALSRTRCVHGLRRAALGLGFWYGLLAGPYLEYRSSPVPAGAHR